MSENRRSGGVTGTSRYTNRHVRSSYFLVVRHSFVTNVGLGYTFGIAVTIVRSP